jgi:hypothetical protein
MGFSLRERVGQGLDELAGAELEGSLFVLEGEDEFVEDGGVVEIVGGGGEMGGYELEKLEVEILVFAD